MVLSHDSYLQFQRRRPFGDLTWDTGGNLYGATSLNTTTSNGEIFELSPQANGSWKETVLYTFPSPDGVGIPQSGVIFDNAGNLYGVTFLGTGGIGTQGAVFELSPQATGPWKLTVIYNFTNGNTGGDPTSRLTFDSSGSLYGILSLPQYGTIFKLSPASGGTWNIKTVHTFNSGSDGNFPQGTLVVDASGNIYGTTTYGGLGCNGSLCGVVYKLTPQSGGTWKETILHQFESAGDGSEPQRGVLLDSSGNLYGTTYFGGSRYGYGTVYEITP